MPRARAAKAKAFGREEGWGTAPAVPGEVANVFMENVRAAGISQTEALRQLVDRCLEQSSPKG